MARSVINPEEFLKRIQQKMKQAIQDDIEKPNDQLTTLLDEIIMADLLVLYGVTGQAPKISKKRCLMFLTLALSSFNQLNNRCQTVYLNCFFKHLFDPYVKANCATYFQHENMYGANQFYANGKLVYSQFFLLLLI